MNLTQKDIDAKAQEVYDLFHNENSSYCVLALLSVIENISVNDKATATFRKSTVSLLDETSFRISSSLRIRSLR